MLKQFLQVMDKSGWDPSSEDLLDLLWLAEQLPVQYPHKSTGRSSKDITLSSTIDRFGNNDQSVQSANIPVKGQLVSAKQTKTAGYSRSFPDVTSQRIEIRVEKKSESALPGKLQISRALWTLRSLGPRKSGGNVDEGRTSESFADAFYYDLRIWDFSFLSERAAWFDVIQIVDISPSMSIWTKTVSEWRHILERHKCYRSMRLYYVNSDALDGQMSLSSTNRGSLFENDNKISPSRINAEAGRTIVLVVSDCVGQAWSDGRMVKLLEYFGEQHQVAVVQVLPPVLWNFSKLNKAHQVYVTPKYRCEPNKRLEPIPEPPKFVTKADSVPQAFPILTLSGRSILPWIKATAGITGQILPSVIFSNQDINKELELTAQQRVEYFYAHASQSAVRLARYVSLYHESSFGLNLVEFMCERILEGLDRSVILEVLYSPIIKILPIDPMDPIFQFHSGVEEILWLGVTIQDRIDAGGKLLHFANPSSNIKFDLNKLLRQGETLPDNWTVILKKTVEPLERYGIHGRELQDAFNIDRDTYFDWAEQAWQDGEWETARTKYQSFLGKFGYGPTGDHAKRRLEKLERVQELSNEINQLRFDPTSNQFSQLDNLSREFWHLASDNRYVQKIYRIVQELRELFNLWENGEYSLVCSRLGELAIDPKNPELIQKAADQLGDRLSDLVTRVRMADEALTKDKQDEAREHMEVARQIHGIDIWRNLYEPYRRLEPHFPREETDESLDDLDRGESGQTQEIQTKQEEEQTTQIAPGEVERALQEENLSRAEQYLKDVKQLSPEWNNIRDRVERVRAEVKRLFGEAREKEQQLAFGEAQDIYNEILKRDRTNVEATRKLGVAQAGGDRPSSGDGTGGNRIS